MITSALHIRFGDISISILPESSDVSLQLPGAYLPFVVGASDRDGLSPVEVVLRACYRQSFDVNLERELFTSGENWTFGLWNGQKVILKHLGGGQLHQALIMEPDLRSGEIYCVGEKWLEDNRIFYPLTYPVDMLLFIHLLGQFGGFLFHSAGVIYEGRAILFVGRSGAGKSTTSKLWLKRPGVTLLNDDRVIVRKRKGQYLAFGNPWHGEVCTISAVAAPLERIFLLKHGEQNRVRPLKPVEAVSRLLSCSFPTYWDQRGMASSLECLEGIVGSVPCFELAFLPDESVVDFVQCL